MKIQIPELEKFDTNSVNVVRILLCELDFYMEKLSSDYNLNTINDINGYIITFTNKLLKSFWTLTLIIEEANDYVAANAITRVLVDNISIFRLIYGNKNSEELLFRHYLYILDGSSSRYKLLPEQITNNGKITKDEYNALSKQIRKTKDNERQNIEFILSELNKLHFRKSNNQAFEQIVEQKNWKYKTFHYYKNIKQNTYSWRELYDFLNLKGLSASYFSYLSNFVHGLSISNIILKEDNDNFEPINCIAIALLGQFRNCILSIFEDKIDDIRKDYIKSEQFKIYWSLVGQKYRDNIIQELKDM